MLYMPEDPTKLRNYAFINYLERSAALRAVTEAETKKPTMADRELIVSRRCNIQYTATRSTVV